MKKLLLMSLDAMIGKDIEILKGLPTFGPILEKASIVKSVETVISFYDLYSPCIYCIGNIS